MTPIEPWRHSEEDDLDFATLLELSLAIGKSLDLHTNADAFFAQLLSRLNLSAVGLFVRSSRLHDHAEDEGGFECVCSIPKFRESGAKIPIDSPLAVRLGKVRIAEVSCTEIESLRPVFCAHSIDQGTVVGAAHGRDILILLHIGWKAGPIPKWELSRLELILSKFGLSVEACLDHAKLIRESARRIELQEKLIRAERLETLGLLVGGVAHDLNNLMMPLINYPAMVRNALPAGSEAHLDLNAMEQAAESAASVIDDLLVMASSRSKPVSAVSLSHCIRAYLNSPELQHLQAAKPEVSLRSSLDSQGRVLGSVQNIGRVIMNLVHNAYDELPGGGSVHVEAKDILVVESYRGYEHVPPGEYALIRVIDDGNGIPENILGRIFEPFVSTKLSNEQGTGLGLSIVYGIVKDMGGYIDLRTSSKGSTFDLYIPHVVDTKTMPESELGGSRCTESSARS